MSYVTVSTKELTKELGITKTTLFRWEQQFSLNIERDRNNSRIYTEEIANTLREIKKLIDAGVTHQDIKTRLNLGNSGQRYNDSYPHNVEVIAPFENKQSTEIEAFLQNFWSKLDEKDERIDILREQVDREREEKTNLKAQNAEMTVSLKYLQKSYEDLEEKLKEAQKRKKIFGIF